MEPDINQNLRFIMLHAPMSVMKTYAEILKIKVPIKNIGDEVDPSNVNTPLISAAR